jgi:hypothetical protein
MDGLDKVQIVELVIQQSVVLLCLMNHLEVVDNLVVLHEAVLIEEPADVEQANLYVVGLLWPENVVGRFLGRVVFLEH